MADKEKKIDNSGAYVVLKDEQRLSIEEQITDTIKNNPNFPDKTGLFLTKSRESLPAFFPVGDEEYVISRKRNQGRHTGSRIVLTKDNYGHRGTGLGGHGFTQCEAIDIVAGSLSCEDRTKTASTQTRANFITDGARIYLTERGDIQHYFALGKSTEATAISSKLKSGIGIKADHTLIMGRERIRIVAGVSAAEGGDRTVGLNSNVNPKIELTSISDQAAQPAVLGDSLVGYLSEIKDEIQSLRNKIQDLEVNLIDYKTAIALHTHNGQCICDVAINPSPEGIQEAAQSIPSFFKTTTGNIRETYQSVQSDFAHVGTSDGELKGTLSDRILSSTVYIGK